MSTQYPLLFYCPEDYQGEDMWISLVKGPEDLYELYALDMLHEEYRCWDRNGVPQAVTWNSASPLEGAAVEWEPEFIVKILRKLAEEARVVYPRREEDPFALLEFIDAALKERRERKEPSLWARLSKFFR